MKPPADQRFVLRRTEVIQAAAEVFAERGYHGASTQLIADRLGMRQASLYYYLGSKEEALEEVCLLGVRGALGLMEEGLARAHSTRERLQSIVRAQLHGLAERCVTWTVFYDQRQHLSADRLARVSAEAQPYRERVRQVLAQGVADGDLRADLDCHLAARALLGLCQSVTKWVMHDRGIDLEHIADEYARLFLDGCLAQPGQAAKAAVSAPSARSARKSRSNKKETS